MSDFQNTTPDPSNLVRMVLAEALRVTWDKMVRINSKHPETDRAWAKRVGKVWISSLRQSFQTRYPDASRFAVFGGTPDRDEAKPDNNVGSSAVFGISGWQRWEFLYDVAVVELDHTPAAFGNRDIQFVKRAIWLVESEVAKDGKEVAVDLSKLRVGAADHKLLLASQTSQRKPQEWLDFISRLSVGMVGEIYLGLMPTYSSNRPGEATLWRSCTAAITLYHWPRGASAFLPAPGGPITQLVHP